MFVAVWPDDATRRRLCGLELGTVPGLKAVEPAQWHVTLRFLGQVDDDLVPVLVDALGQAAAHVVGPVRCILGPATSWFSGAKVLQIPVAGLDRAAEAVREATVPVVPDPTPGRMAFAGHLTIARLKGRRPDPTARAAVAGLPFSAEFAVKNLALVSSHLSPEGARYSTLARLPLPCEPPKPC
jgi:2'-5' RNA ligase